MRIALQPSANKGSRKHYADTIKNLVPTKLIKSYAPTEVQGVIDDAFPEGEAAVWGVTPGKDGGNFKKWSSLGTGDLVLFAKNKKLFAKGTVVAKFRNEELAEQLWGRDDQGMTWEYLYLLTDISEINIDQTEMNAALGYQPNNIVQGFTVLPPEKSNLLDLALELAGNVVPPEVSEAEFRDAVAPFDPNTALDRDVNSKSRKEQAYLRRILLGQRRKANCAICGQEFAVEFLRTAHIKARSHCTQDERLDAKNIVLPMCAFGCDELYERGHIGVENGKIIGLKPMTTDDRAKAYVNGIIGRDVGMWRDEREPYFKWHRERNTGA
jgi:hypothetical protein